MKRTGDDVKVYALRLPHELYAWLTAYAAGQGRSMNEQIIWILRQEAATARKSEGADR